MSGRKNRTIEVSAETYDLLVAVGEFPETVDECIKRLINGTHTFVATNRPSKGKQNKRKVRKKIGCEWCDRVFVGGQGYASHLRTYHPEHYNPKNPVPLSERKTVLYRTEADRRKAEMEKEA